MKLVEKKCDIEYFHAVCIGSKRFELRRDEDGVQVGDVLLLREWDPDHMAYTGRSIRVTVRYVLRDVPQFGLMPGHCIMGF